MSTVTPCKGGVAAPGGFLAASGSAGIKESGAPDLALLYSTEPAAWAGVFTTNRLAAAPVQLTRERLRRRRPLRAVLINAGNANAATGEEGRRRAVRIAGSVAREAGLPPAAVVPASTGVIGVQLPVPRIVRALPALVRRLSPRGGRPAAEAIMTTDTRPKEAGYEVDLGGGQTVRIGGMAKGSGMIHPDMATMLAFLTTDAVLSFDTAQRLLRAAVEPTFNRINVDGDTSTNDTVLLLANGASGHAVPARGKARARFKEALRSLCGGLAEMIVRDGEGATKFVEVRVTGARSRADARRAAGAVADSKLVQTAWFGEDLNWGRIAAALGRSGAAVSEEKLSLSLNRRPVVASGRLVSPARFARAAAEMRAPELRFRIDLGLGRAEDRVLTCDISHEYVRINAEYTT